jgi:prephenate dehydratase
MVAGPFTLLPCVTFQGVVRAVLGLSADYGVLPVENLIAGPVQAALDALDTVGLERLAEHQLPIRLALLGLADSSAAQIREVLSHAVALRQCTRWLADHPKVRAVEAPDTAGAARMVAIRRDRHAAAIAAPWAAAQYGLVILEEQLQDRPDNTTRFVLVRRRAESALMDATDDPGT